MSETGIGIRGWLRRLVAGCLTVAAAIAVTGCGGGSHATPTPKKPNAAAISAIQAAYADVALACLSANVDETKLDNDVSTLIDSFKKYGNARFSIGGPPLTLRSILEHSRDQLRNCAAAGRAPNASSLADQIDHELEK